MTKCNEPGCQADGIECRFYDYDEQQEIIEHYCGEHCRKNGYCWYCGQFWAGVESFDFDPAGLCSNCRPCAEADLGEHDVDPYDYCPGPWEL